MNHLEASRFDGVARNNVAVERGTAMLKGCVRFWGSGNQIELFNVERSVLFGPIQYKYNINTIIYSLNERDKPLRGR